MGRKTNMRLSRLLALSAVSIFTMAILHGPAVLALSANTVIGSGSNWAGMLSDGTYIDRSSPVNFTLPSSAVVKEFLYGIGGSEAVFLTTDGRVFGVGWNAYGQLGNGTTNDTATPVQMILPPGTVISDILGDNGSYYLLSSTGNVYMTGYNYAGNAGDGTTNDVLTPQLWPLPPGAVASRVISDNSAVVITTTDGRVFGAGNGASLFGTGISGGNATTPQQFPLPGGVIATKTWLTGSGLFVLGSDGVLYVAGSNFYGQLGTGTTSTWQPTPAVVILPGGRTAADVYSYTTSTTYIKLDDGTLYGTGRNLNGQLGIGNTTNQSTPVAFPLPGGTVVDRMIVKGAASAVVLTTDGKIFSAGNNYYDTMGIGSNNTINSSPVQTPYPLGAVVTDYVTDQSGAYVITSSGDLYATGAQTFGKLGNGVNSMTSIGAPIQVPLPIGTTVTRVAAGNSSIAVVSSAGKVYSFGRNPSGQLGNGTTSNILSPFEYPLPAQFTPQEVVSSDDTVYVLGNIPPPASALPSITGATLVDPATVSIVGTDLSGTTSLTVGSTTVSISPCPSVVVSPCFTILDDSALTIQLPSPITSSTDITVTNGTGASTPYTLVVAPAPGSTTLASTGQAYSWLLASTVGFVVILTIIVVRLLLPRSRK
jgi:alpha-tubulin suppressor-like RCC1 family protein